MKSIAGRYKSHNITDYRHILDAKVGNGLFNFTIKVPTLRYMNDFMNCKCALDMMEMEIFPNAKEISESFAMYHAAKKLPNIDLADPSIHVFAIGDGRSPRTAATFAFRSKWTAWSIDPNLKPEPVKWSAVKRLSINRVKIENFPEVEVERAVICAPHSHAQLPVALTKIKAKRRDVIAMPCCVPQTLDRMPDVHYDDFGIWSPERAILIWYDV